MTGKLAGCLARRCWIPSQENGTNRVPGTSASITGVTSGALQPFGGPGRQSPRCAPTHIAIRSGRSVVRTEQIPLASDPRGVKGMNAQLWRPGDPEPFARSIWNLTSDPTLQRLLASEGHRLFQREF
jgi:hypothetical protein